MSSLVLCIECERDHVVTQSVELLDQSTLIFSVWWAHQDLNLESTDYESGALTNYAIGPEGRGRVTGFACSKHPVEACVVQAVPQTGLPSRTRTCNLRLRRPLHYPVVLRAARAKYPTPAEWGQVKWCAGRLSGSGGTHHAGEHGAHTLIQ